MIDVYKRQVALSRCKTLEGLVLESPLRKEAIISDSVAVSYTHLVVYITISLGDSLSEIKYR